MQITLLALRPPDTELGAVDHAVDEHASTAEWSDSPVSLTEAAVGFELPDRLDGP